MYCLGDVESRIGCFNVLMYSRVSPFVSQCVCPEGCLRCPGLSDLLPLTCLTSSLTTPPVCWPLFTGSHTHTHIHIGTHTHMYF